MQRQSIRQGQKLFERSLDLQMNATEAFVRNSLAAQRSVQRQGTEFAQKLFDAQFDAMESAMDGDEFRSTMERQFEERSDLNQQLLNAEFEQGTEFARHMMNAQFDAVESTLDGDEYDFREAVDRQFDEFDETQNEAWDELEDDFVEAFENLGDQQKLMVAQSMAAFVDVQEEAEQQTVEGLHTAEAAIEASERQAHEVAETAQMQLEEISGLGSTYADRLREQGIESHTQLAQATVETIAESADVSEEQAEEWIEAARYQS